MFYRLKNTVYKINRALLFVRASFFIPFLLFHPNRSLIKEDIKRWMECCRQEKKNVKGLLFLLVDYREFRNLFYFRIRKKLLAGFILPENRTLKIDTPTIGKGLFIQHGDTTVIQAKSIGENCWINQSVTIMGHINREAPVILNNVTICAGAKVLGNIKIGNNSIIGANAVVEKDVPDDCTIAGIPGVIIKRNGIRVKEQI